MNTTQEHDTTRRTFFGRPRFGGGTGVLIGLSLLIGTVSASGLGLLVVLLGSENARPWLGFLIGATVTLPVCTAGAWALLVDRATLAGAPRDPDSSVESHWYDKAAATTFNVLFAALGIGAGVFAFVDVPVDTSLVLIGYVVLAMTAFWISYLLRKRSER